MVSSGYTGCNAAATITMLSLGLASTGLVYSGASLTQMEFATPYAGIVTAIANTFANTPGFLSPLIAGVVTENQVRMKGGETERHRKSQSGDKRCIGMIIDKFISRQLLLHPA